MCETIMFKISNSFKEILRNRNGKLAVISILLLLTSAGSAILVNNYSILSDSVTVEQAIVIDGTQGSASLDPELTDGNIVGTGNNTKSWSMAVNVNGTISTTVSLTGADSSSVQDHITTNISKNNGLAFIIDKEFVSGSSDQTVDLTSGSATINLQGPVDTVQDGIRLESRFPINYDVTSKSTGQNMQFKINIDASGASLS